MIEVTHEAHEFFLNVAMQSRGDVDVVACDVQLHGIFSLGNHFPLTRLRSLDGDSPIVSRYFATVRRATGIPSPDSISAIRLSLSGAAGSSSRISLRILARIAVEDVPEPSLPSTWLEKK